MIDLEDVQRVLDDVPPSATLRVACAGTSFYFARKDAELTVDASSDAFRIVGMVGDSANSLRQGAVIVRADRVDFIQVL